MKEWGCVFYGRALTVILFRFITHTSIKLVRLYPCLQCIESIIAESRTLHSHVRNTISPIGGSESRREFGGQPTLDPVAIYSGTK
jgi:hypothetical protein